MNYEKLTQSDGKEYYLVPVEEKEKKVWQFNKESYKLQNTFSFIKRLDYSLSVFYYSEKQCTEALHDYIWENHKITAKENLEITTKFHNTDNGDYGYKHFYCNYIINQKKGEL